MTTSKPSVQICTSPKGILTKMQAIQKTRYLSLLCSKSSLAATEFSCVYTSCTGLDNWRVQDRHDTRTPGQPMSANAVPAQLLTTDNCKSGVTPLVLFLIVCSEKLQCDHHAPDCCACSDRNDFGENIHKHLHCSTRNRVWLLLRHVYDAADCTYGKQRAFGIPCQTNGCGHSCDWAHT